MAIGASLASVLLSVRAWPDAALSSALLCPIVTGAALGSTGVTHWQARRLAQWSWEHYRLAQTSLDEARDRQVELKQALEDLALRNRQLSLLNEKVAGLRLAAERAERTKAAFLSRVSHEFRTPLEH